MTKQSTTKYNKMRAFIAFSVLSAQEMAVESEARYNTAPYYMPVNDLSTINNWYFCLFSFNFPSLGWIICCCCFLEIRRLFESSVLCNWLEMSLKKKQRKKCLNKYFCAKITKRTKKKHKYTNTQCFDEQ